MLNYLDVKMEAVPFYKTSVTNQSTRLYIPEALIFYQYLITL